MNRREILQFVADVFLDHEAIMAEEVCAVNLPLDYTLRENVDDGRYYIEFLIPIIINDIKLVAIAEQTLLKVSREYTQIELTSILYQLQEKAENIIKQTNKCKKK